MKNVSLFFLLVNILFNNCVNSVIPRENQITIGNQIWMNKNLNIEYFRNGDPIPEAKTEIEWAVASENKQPAWCHVNNKKANDVKYGKIYNWYALNDLRGLAPKGWHIPTDIEWNILTDYLGDESIAGFKLKAQTDWNKDGKGINSSGFSGFPSGCRSYSGYFEEISNIGFWWSSTEFVNNCAWYRSLHNTDSSIFRHFTEKGSGLSVRCIKD